MKNNYDEFLTKEYMMGPNSLLLLEEMLGMIPEEIKGRVLDLGCGRAVTSLMLARETKADMVYAADLWITATENYRRVRSWGEEERIIPLHSDASDLPFADEYFNAVVSVDAYHYFGCKEGFFAGKILPLLEKGGVALIAVPGIRDEFEDDRPDLLNEWADTDAQMFHGCRWWREHILSGAEGVDVSVCSTARFDAIWEDWFRSGHEYAAVDRSYFARGLGKVLDFVIMIICRK